MSGGVKHYTDSNDVAHHFVERNVLIQGQNGGQRSGSYECVALPQYKDQYEHTVKVQEHPSNVCN